MYEREDDGNEHGLSDFEPFVRPAVGGDSGVFVLTVLAFYVVVATLGLETGPLHPDVTMGIRFVALAIAAAVFVHTVPVPYPSYAVTLLLTGFVVEGVRRYVLSGFEEVAKKSGIP